MSTPKRVFLTIVAFVAIFGTAGVVMFLIATRMARDITPYNDSIESYLASYSATSHRPQPGQPAPEPTPGFTVRGERILVVDPDKRIIYAQAQRALPDSLRSTSPADVTLVVWASCVDLVVGRYEPDGGQAYQNFCWLTFVKGGTVVSQTGLTGHAPPERVGQRGDVHGPPVDPETIAGYIAALASS